ncbi:MAG: hypothetical protein ABJA76_01165 [Mucilaginibacter sp.]
MQLFKSAIIFFCFAVLMLVAKPFIGFNSLANINRLKHLSICVKAFTKRKQEYVEGGSFDITFVQKKLAKPLDLVLLHFAALLAIILPFAFAAQNLSNRTLRRLQLSLYPTQPSYLLNSNLII